MNKGGRPKRETIIKDKDIEIGKRLLLLRKEAKNPKQKNKIITQQDLADLLDVSVQQIRNYEHGRQGIPKDKVIKLSTIFGVNTDYLLCRTDYKNPKEELYAEKSNEPIKTEMLAYFTTDELLAEIRRRIEK